MQTTGSIRDKGVSMVDSRKDSPLFGLYSSWFSMNRRAKLRGDSCNVCGRWEVYKNFKEDALLNGWVHGKILLRNKDVGDYSLNNTRWGSYIENGVDKYKRKVFLLSPEGVPIIRDTTISEIAREFGLDRSNLSKLIRGIFKTSMGWKLIKQEK